MARKLSEKRHGKVIIAQTATRWIADLVAIGDCLDARPIRIVLSAVCAHARPRGQDRDFAYHDEQNDGFHLVVCFLFFCFRFFGFVREQDERCSILGTTFKNH
jgi:hypothetical protein